ncbi:MAG: GntR family transcriptional regulator [Pseudonocardia sp.]|nr:GntR family transcriptional regulator [Pseudonocardia sp.]
MYRTEPAALGKRDRLVADLVGQIRSGRLAQGAQLPGEQELARRYRVSRGTVRGALAELQRRDLIATQSGVGSFVTFDGVRLDQSVGWAAALARSGFRIDTTLLAIERTTEPELTERFGIEQFIAVRRLRRDPSAGPVSLEVALVPAVGPLTRLPEHGLVDGSLTASLARAGLRAVRGEQWISAEALDEDTAAPLERSVGELFLKAIRVSTDGSGRLVERVVSLLDPARFRFHLTFGGR